VRSTLTSRIVLGGHVVLLLAVATVPLSAVAQAVLALCGATHRDAGDIVNLSRWLLLLRNTAIVTSVALALALGAGLSVGYVVARTDLPGRRALLLVLLLLAILPIAISIIFIGAVIPLWSFAGSTLLCGLLHGILAAPLAILLLALAYRGADRETEDQARLDAGGWRVWWHITLPLCRGAIGAVGLFVLLIVGTDFTIADILIVRTFAEEVYYQYALRRAAAGPILAALPMFLVIAGLVAAALRGVGREPPHAPQATRPRTVALGRLRWPLAALLHAVVLGLVGAPLLAVLRRIGALDAFAATVPDLARELLVSNVLSISGALIITLPSVGLAWLLARSGRWRWGIALVIVGLLASPAPVVGISLITLLNRPGLPGMLYDSPAVIVVGYVVRFLPVAVLLLAPAILRLPRDLEHAAKVDGASWIGVQRHVVWPAIARSVLGVALVLHILCFGEIAATVLLAPPGWSTASVRAFTLIHFGVYRDLAVLAVCMIACVALPWVGLMACLSARRRAMILG
jgi:iron(III) transport system permease protein